MDLKVIKLTKVLKLNLILTVIGCFIFLFGKEVVLVDKQYILADNNQNSKPNWKTIGQGGGGNIVDVVCHPTDSNIVWVVTDLTGIFKSKDGGITYDRMSGAIEQQELLKNNSTNLGKTATKKTTKIELASNLTEAFYYENSVSIYYKYPTNSEKKAARKYNKQVIVSDLLSG